MVSWARRTQKMPQDKPIKKIADFLSIFTVCHKLLKIPGEVEVSCLEIFDDVRGPLGFIETN